MTYSAVITQVQCDPDAAGRLACAVELAQRFDATLIGLGAEMIPGIADTGLSGIATGWVVDVRESIEARLKLAEHAFTAAARSLRTETIWVSGVSMPARAIAAASRAADLVVAGGKVTGDAYSTAPVGELALSCGRPVLVAPSKPSTIGRKVLLAWRDSREARRALSDALPFLLAADHVEVVEVCTHEDADIARYRVDDVAAALVRRGATASGMVLVQPGPTGMDLLEQADRMGADLIVSGAYGHTRLGEWFFGGVTRDLLSQSDIALLLSH